LVQLGATADDQAPVLVVYATVTTIVTPIGGLLIGAFADELSLWGALGASGLVILALAVCLRRRLRVFDELGPAPQHGDEPVARHPHLHLLHLLGCDAPGALEVFHHVHHDDEHTRAAPSSAAPANAVPVSH
jgi:hypothetical protein